MNQFTAPHLQHTHAPYIKGKKDGKGHKNPPLDLNSYPAEDGLKQEPSGAANLMPWATLKDESMLDDGFIGGIMAGGLLESGKGEGGADRGDGGGEGEGGTPAFLQGPPSPAEMMMRGAGVGNLGMTSEGHLRYPSFQALSVGATGGQDGEPGALERGRVPHAELTLQDPVFLESWGEEGKGKLKGQGNGAVEKQERGKAKRRRPELNPSDPMPGAGGGQGEVESWVGTTQVPVGERKAVKGQGGGGNLFRAQEKELREAAALEVAETRAREQRAARSRAGSEGNSVDGRSWEGGLSTLSAGGGDNGHKGAGGGITGEGSFASSHGMLSGDGGEWGERGETWIEGGKEGRGTSSSEGLGGSSRRGGEGGEKEGGRDGKGGRKRNLTAEEKVAQSRHRNREHARNTRLRKKAYTKKLKELVDDLERQREEEDRAKDVLASRALEEVHHRNTVVHSFLHCRARDERDRRKWAQVLDEDCVLTLPITPYRFFPRGEVHKGVRVVQGLDAVMADASSLRLLMEAVEWSALERAHSPSSAPPSFMSSLNASSPSGWKIGAGVEGDAADRDIKEEHGARAGFPPVRLEYVVNAQDIIMSKDTLMCRWTLRTSRSRLSFPSAHVSSRPPSSRPDQPPASSMQQRHSPSSYSSSSCSPPSPVAPLVQKERTGPGAPSPQAGKGSSGAHGEGEEAGNTSTLPVDRSNSADKYTGTPLQQGPGKHGRAIQGVSGSKRASQQRDSDVLDKLEFGVEGMLYCRFNEQDKLTSVEMVFDVMMVMQQLQRAAGVPCEYLIVPNSLEGACQRAATARVLVRAEAPYPVLHVNEHWTNLRGQTQVDVEGQPLDLLEGASEAPGTRFMVDEVMGGRPASCIMLVFKACRQAFTGYLQLFPLHAAPGGGREGERGRLAPTHILGILRKVHVTEPEP